MEIDEFDPILETPPMTTGELLDSMESVKRMTRDLSKAARTLGDGEARFLVSNYYAMQAARIRSGNQISALAGEEEPHEVIAYFYKQQETLEAQVKSALDKYTQSHPMGAWMRQVFGVGPVLSAGLLAHLDITRAPTAGHFWSYAGLDPRVKWPSKADALAWIKQNGLDIHTACAYYNRNLGTIERFATRDSDGEEITLTATRLANALTRRPWNADLKVVCWKVGQSFKMFNKNEKCFYGKLYGERKVYEVRKNLSRDYAELAAIKAEQVGKDTEAYAHYSQGMLPPAHIDARASRWAVKIFLSHLHAEWYRVHFKQEPPKPFALAILGHAHMIESPH